MPNTIFLVIINLIILESLLSVDNAAVLATMVKDLPEQQKNKALRYGLLGAYAFRGLCLLFASFLVQFSFLKILGGVYLLYLVYGHYTSRNDTIEEKSEKKDSKIYQFALKLGINKFWATIILVEIMDLAFSIDNVFAAVALSNIFWVIMVGVGIGILAMRFVAGLFVKLINKYPHLERSAFIVIAFLGVKLIFSGTIDYFTSEVFNSLKVIISSHIFDLIFSFCMMLIFFVPLIYKKSLGEIKKIS